MRLPPSDYKYIALLKKAPLELSPRGWRFGTRPVADSVVERLVAFGRAKIEGAQLIIRQRPEDER